jgi:AcrR family transcriptional regulator
MSPTETIRRTLDSSTDPRASRTRVAILDAVHVLAVEDEPVTVASVAKRAGVGRSSFYSHFASLDALALSVLQDAFERIGAAHAAALDGADTQALAAMRRSQVELVDHYVQHRALYAAVSALPLSAESHRVGVRAMAGIVQALLETHPHLPSECTPVLTARYIAGAAHGLLDAWARGEVEASPAELVDHLMALMPPWLAKSH